MPPSTAVELPVSCRLQLLGEANLTVTTGVVGQNGDHGALGAPEASGAEPSTAESSGGERPRTSTPQLAAGKPLALLTYLHCAPARTASREQLLELLWSDAEPEAGRHTLRQTLWYVRRKLGFDPFTTTGDGVRLVTPFVSDRDDFLAALSADNSELALTHYHGDFFPDFAAPGGAAFEHWADIERARLRALFLAACTRVVRDRLGKSRVRDALTVARRALDMAPKHQVAWRLVLESYLAADDTIGAAVEVERLQRWLADDDMEPEHATAQLIKAVRNGRPRTETDSAAEPSALRAELVGREAEFSELLTAFEATSRGHARHVHISAPAGLGKSRLLEGFAARLRTSRTRVVAVRGTSAERTLPFAFAAHLVAALVPLRGASAVSPDTASTLVALAPAASSFLRAEPDRSTGDDALRRRSLALTELVTTLAHDAPVVLLIDDVHWIDAQSRTLLSSLATRIDNAPVLLVTAARSADGFLDSTSGAHRITLAPLSVEDVGALVMSVGRLPNEPWANALAGALHDSSHGSPLLVLETLQLVMEREQLTLVDRNWSTPDAAALLATLEGGKAMQQRISALPPSARDTLLRLSVVGTYVEASALPLLLPDDGRESLTDLESRGLVVRADEHYRVAHDEIAALAMDMASAADRVRANDAAAEYLERTAGDDLTRLLRAGFHRSRASDAVALDRVFLRAVRTAHVSGEHGAIRNLGREILGANAPLEDIERLVRRLPWRTRHRPLWFLTGALTLASAVVLLAVVALWPNRSVAANRSLLTFDVRVGDSSLFLALPDVTSDLSTDDAIDLEQVSAPLDLEAIRGVGISGRLRDGSYVGVRLDSSPTQGIDVVRVMPNNTVIPMLNGPHDQSTPILSPGGGRILFTTGALHPQQRPELAIVNADGSGERRLTVTDDRDLGQAWSLEGTRFAYVRSPVRSSNAEVCWRSVDTMSGACMPLGIEGAIPNTIIGWRSDNELLAVAESVERARRMLLSVDIESRRATVLDTTGADYRADPSGRVVMCVCRVNGHSEPVLALFSPTTPQLKRVLRFRGQPLYSGGGRFLVWAPSSTSLVRISTVGAMRPTVGQRVRYRAVGRDAADRERSVPLVTWSSPDTSIVRSEGGGVFHTLRAGTARIVASAGGAVNDTQVVTVRESNFTPVFRETWQAPLDERWLGYGDPPSTMTNGVLHLNGDEHLSSGVISRVSFAPSGGVGVRLRVKFPLTASQWQSIGVAIGHVIPDDSIAKWRGRVTGLQPTSWEPMGIQRVCTFSAPRREGGEYLRLMSLEAGGVSASMPSAAGTIADARWRELVLQIFDDGRCGVAIDGTAITMSENSVALDRPFRVMLNGRSVGTDIQVGIVEAWTGILDAIDWGVLGSRPVAAARRP